MKAVDPGDDDEVRFEADAAEEPPRSRARRKRGRRPGSSRRGPRARGGPSFPHPVDRPSLQAKAQEYLQQAREEGRGLQPVAARHLAISQTFWGRSWCRNLESYSDYESRLPRGRSYLRASLVVHLSLHPGRIEGEVVGRELYRQTITVKELSPDERARLRQALRAAVSSVQLLLEGALSEGVLEMVSDPATGLFPRPSEIQISCTCLDWAGLCKHAAAVLYGVGVRLDEDPALLFRLRGLSPADLIGTRLLDDVLAAPDDGSRRLDGDLEGIFGIEFDEED